MEANLFGPSGHEDVDVEYAGHARLRSAVRRTDPAPNTGFVTVRVANERLSLQHLVSNLECAAGISDPRAIVTRRDKETSSKSLSCGNSLRAER
jgi:hypothetical protein